VCLQNVAVRMHYKQDTRNNVPKIKQRHYRPGQTLRVPGGWGSHIFWQSAQEGGKVVSPTHRPSLTDQSTTDWPTDRLAYFTELNYYINFEGNIKLKGLVY
jgi:hypothetical protein